jgi:hypothetical protein
MRASAKLARAVAGPERGAAVAAEIRGPTSTGGGADRHAVRAGARASADPAREADAIRCPRRDGSVRGVDPDATGARLRGRRHPDRARRAGPRRASDARSNGSSSEFAGARTTRASQSSIRATRRQQAGEAPGLTFSADPASRLAPRGAAKRLRGYAERAWSTERPSDAPEAASRGPVRSATHLHRPAAAASGGAVRSGRVRPRASAIVMGLRMVDAAAGTDAGARGETGRARGVAPSES